MVQKRLTSPAGPPRKGPVGSRGLPIGNVGRAFPLLYARPKAMYTSDDVTDHYRCPVCGKLSKPENFGIEDGEFISVVAHQVDVATQHFVGRGRGGFEWEKAPADEEVVEVLRQVVLATYERLSEQLGVDPWETDEEG